MAPVTNGRYLFKEIPVGAYNANARRWVYAHAHLTSSDFSGFPVPGQTTVYDESQTIDLDTVPLNGGFLVKVLVLSIDPYMRSKMRDPSVKSYTVRVQGSASPLVQYSLC